MPSKWAVVPQAVLRGTYAGCFLSPGHYENGKSSVAGFSGYVAPVRDSAAMPRQPAGMDDAALEKFLLDAPIVARMNGPRRGKCPAIGGGTGTQRVAQPACGQAKKATDGLRTAGGCCGKPTP